MMTHRILPAIALPVALFAAIPALAEPVCSGGGYAADAVIVPLNDIGPVSAAMQYAWDGAGTVQEVCNLLSDTGDFYATWSLFSGEVDATLPGICVSLISASGEEWFSCQSPEAVTLAFAATPGTQEATLQFETWEPQAPTVE